jgi:branched-chain amino acid transport system substrate-binding protein
MKKNLLGALSVVAAAAVALSLTTTSANAATSVVLAFQGPLTGDSAQAGQDELAGAKYALAVYNATNPKVKVTIKQVDDQGSGSQAAIVAPGVAKDKTIIGVVGSAYSGASENSFPSYKAAGLTMVSPSASRVTLTKPGAPDFGGPVFHRVVGNDSVQGPALARLATKGVSSPAVYVVDDKSPYGAGLRDYTLPSLGSKVVGKDSVLVPVADWSSTVQAVIQSKANVVIFCGYDKDAGPFVKALRDGGYKGVFASGDGTATSTFPQTAGNAAAAGTVLTEGDTPFDNVATAAQKKAFTKASGVKVAGGYVTNTINAVNAFLTCIKAGKTTRAAIATCISTGKFPNFTGGTFQFDANGDVKGGAPIGAYAVQADGTIKYTGQA